MATVIEGVIFTKAGQEMPTEAYDALMREQMEWAEDLGPEIARRAFEREGARLIAGGVA
jgi:hypothetical protein